MNIITRVYLSCSSPEGLGVISGAMFLISCFLFIPIPFLDYSELQVQLPWQQVDLLSCFFHYSLLFLYVLYCLYVV